METIVLVFEKIEIEDKTKYGTFYLSWKAEIIINERDIDGIKYNHVFESIYTTIILNIQESLGKRSAWIINSVMNHNGQILKCCKSSPIKNYESWQRFCQKAWF